MLAIIDNGRSTQRGFRGIDLPALGGRSRPRLTVLAGAAAALMFAMFAAAPTGLAVRGIAPAQAHAAQIGIDWSNQRVWIKTSSGEIRSRGVASVWTRPCITRVGLIASRFVAPWAVAGVAAAGTSLCYYTGSKLNGWAWSRSTGLWASVGRHGGSNWGWQGGRF